MLGSDFGLCRKSKLTKCSNPYLSDNMPSNMLSRFNCRNCHSSIAQWQLQCSYFLRSALVASSLLWCSKQSQEPTNDTDWMCVWLLWSLVLWHSHPSYARSCPRASCWKLEILRFENGRFDLVASLDWYQLPAAVLSGPWLLINLPGASSIVLLFIHNKHQTNVLRSGWLWEADLLAKMQLRRMTSLTAFFSRL